MASPHPMQRIRLLARQLRTDLAHARGEWRQRLAGVEPGPDAVLLVLGCQRSGTTLMTRIFAADPRAKVYPEQSSMSASDGHRLRLDDLDGIARRIAASRFPLVVLKPLVESQNTPDLLAAIGSARGLWMFRHYTDVARSNLTRFGIDNGICNLRSISRRAGDWRSERVSPQVAAVVDEHFSDAMDPWDAAALFWWARNALFFERGLDRRNDTRTCRYEELAGDPARVIREIYAFLRLPPPGPEPAARVSDRSVGLGREIHLSAPVRELCDDMHERLLAVHARRPRCA